MSIRKDLDQILPVELTELKNWHFWELSSKIPYTRNGKKASCDNPETWLGFEEAYDYVQGCPSVYGLGFQVGNGIIGIDLDNCVEEHYHTLNEFSEKIFNELNTYTEYSPSNTGVHMFVKCDLPQEMLGGRKTMRIEVYPSRHYLTVTGEYVGNEPSPIRALTVDEYTSFVTKYIPNALNVVPNNSLCLSGNTLIPDDNDLITRIMCSASQSKFEKLYYRGDISGYPSESEATAALLLILSFYCRKDIAQMDRIFRTSSLMRSKWDSKRGNSTWGMEQIINANSVQQKTYNPEYNSLNEISVDINKQNESRDHEVKFLKSVFDYDYYLKTHSLKKVSKGWFFNTVNGELFDMVVKYYGQYCTSIGDNAMVELLRQSKLSIEEKDDIAKVYDDICMMVMDQIEYNYYYLKMCENNIVKQYLSFNKRFERDISTLGAANAFGEYRKNINSLCCSTADFQTKTASDVQFIPRPELKYIVKDLIPLGQVVNLAGPPKCGKSYFILQMAHAIVNGQDFLERPTMKSPIFALFIDDDTHRVERRLQDTFSDYANAPDFHWDTRRRGIEDEYFDLLNYKIKEIYGLKLIIIDIMDSFKDEKRSSKMSDKKDFDIFYGRLREMALENELTILLVHHFRKGSPDKKFSEITGIDDKFNSILGSVGITASADTSIILWRTETQKVFQLLAQSNDYEGQDIIVAHENCVWKLYKDMEELNNTEEITDELLKGIKCVVELTNNPILTKKDINKIGEGKGLSTKTVEYRLKTFINKRYMENVMHGKYRWLMPIINKHEEVMPDSLNMNDMFGQNESIMDQYELVNNDVMEIEKLLIGI